MLFLCEFLIEFRVTCHCFCIVPSEPRNIELVASTNTSLTISWEEPEHLNGILKMYIIYYKKISENHERGDETNYKREAPQRNTKWKIKSLSVYSSYIFFVQAYTSAGPGNWSMRFLAATKPGGKKLEQFCSVGRFCVLDTVKYFFQIHQVIY